MMSCGDYLTPRIDKGHDAKRSKYRKLNLLYCVTPGWKLEDGGHLELWDQGVQECELIPSCYNRLVIMETNKYSWHSVSLVHSFGHSYCVSNYFFYHLVIRTMLTTIM